MNAIWTAIKTFFGFGIPSIYVYAAIALAVGGAWLGFKTHYFNEGVRYHQQLVETANKAAGKKANDGAARVKACLESGGHWQQGNGRCGS